jgi:hypothetical protein
MPGTMRYPDSGGLPAEGRARREVVRLQAAQLFAQDASPVQVAHRLRVSTKGVTGLHRSPPAAKSMRSGGRFRLVPRGTDGYGDNMTGSHPEMPLSLIDDAY